ncbi:MAG: hypothetical protein FIA92_06320 [Chloroflexi bacterium]|nr:hypothetical protein [Chloroflexota bacterium]
MNVPARYRLPIAILASIAVVVLIFAAVALVSQPRPSDSPSPSPSPSASVDPTSSPEGVVRAFFDALARARRTDDPTLLTPFVTSTVSSAYLTASGFLEGQKQVGKASVITTNELRDLRVDTQDGEAVVTFTHQMEGYDIDYDTGEPLESPTALPDVTVRVEVRQVDGRWLVDRFENMP